MLIPIKIQCGCGQRYAFDVEAGVGRMPAAVACPVCGADGTAAANAMIAQSVPPPPRPVVAVAPVGAVRLNAAAPAPAVRPAASAPSAPMAAPHGAAPRAGQPDRTQAEVEARAKIFWGDPLDEVVKYLMMQGYAHAEASALAGGMFQERAANLRGIGIRKVVIGIPLMAVPVVAYFIFVSAGIFFIKIFAITLLAGLWGGWMVLRGSIMLMSPKSETGDVADQ